jgi:hypothetical protein
MREYGYGGKIYPEIQQDLGACFKKNRIARAVLPLDDKYILLEEDMNWKTFFTALFLVFLSAGIVCATGSRQTDSAGGGGAL